MAIDHKQSVAEHVLEAQRQERLAEMRLARRVARGILREITVMGEADGEDTADSFFSPTVVRTRAKVRGVQERLLYLVEEIVEQGRKHA